MNLRLETFTSTRAITRTTGIMFLIGTLPGCTGWTRVSGDATIAASAPALFRARSYSVEFPIVDLSAPGHYEWRTCDVPDGQYTFVLEMREARTVERVEAAATHVEVSVGQQTGEFAASASGSLAQDWRRSTGGGGPDTYWHEALRRVALRPGAEYVVKLDVRVTAPGAPLSARPVLQDVKP